MRLLLLELDRFIVLLRVLLALGFWPTLEVFLEVFETVLLEEVIGLFA